MERKKRGRKCFSNETPFLNKLEPLNFENLQFEKKKKNNYEYLNVCWCMILDRKVQYHTPAQIFNSPTICSFSQPDTHFPLHKRTHPNQIIHFSCKLEIFTSLYISKYNPPRTRSHRYSKQCVGKQCACPCSVPVAARRHKEENLCIDCTISPMVFHFLGHMAILFSSKTHMVHARKYFTQGINKHKAVIKPDICVC